LKFSPIHGILKSHFKDSGSVTQFAVLEIGAKNFLEIRRNKMKRSTIVLSILFSILLVLAGCGNNRYDVVKNGYLKAFGDQVTIGEALEVVSGGSIRWEAKELAPSEAEKDTHYLVEAKWEGSGGNIVVQFVVKNDGSNFRLHGSLIGGKFNNAFVTVLAIKKAYNEKNK
jgi:hypothetical protein